MNHKPGFRMLLALLLLALIPQSTAISAPPAATVVTTYYISQSMGDDANDGISPGSPFKSVSRINNLVLQPGDRVLFKCGDVWRVDPLVIVMSGDKNNPIIFGSYPAGCLDRPVLSGAQPVSGWVHESGNIYFAELDSGLNAGKFPKGINQLFRGDDRLLLGRWPNIDGPDGGYATVDSQPSSTQLSDSQLPPGDWTGALLHIKNIRWSILNRKVTGSDGSTLTLGYKTDCWGGCTGWGYFLNGHRATLDQDGEWFYDPSNRRVYLYSSVGIPVNIEGSAVLREDTRAAGGIILGEDFGDPIAYVTVENLSVQRWFRHGITTPTNFRPSENHHLVLAQNLISDVDGVGINLASWVFAPDDERPAGWRGGYELTVTGNTIERANQMGINSYARNSIFTGNTLRDVARIENLGTAGMGCGYELGDAAGGICTEDGDGIRIKIDQVDDTGHHNTFTGNRLERIGYNGIDVFGYGNTFSRNVILQACISKGDCGAVRAYGRDNLDSTSVHDLIFTENILIDVIGNTDGCRGDFDPLFGFGLYLDHYARDITVQGNTIISATVHGVLFQNATGSVLDNTLYNNGRTYPYAGAQLRIGDTPAYVAAHTGNILYSLNVDARTLSADSLNLIGASDNNRFFSPYRDEQIRVNGDKTLAGWQVYSGLDGGSVEHWFTLNAGDPPRSQIFYNDTVDSKTFSLGNVLYVDLDHNPVSGELTLDPFQSQILIQTGQVADLSLSMALLSSPETIPGAPVSYTITIDNHGLAAANQVRLENPLPAEIISTSWGVDLDDVNLEAGSRYTWEIDQLAAGETYTFTVSGQYNPALVSGTPLLLTATTNTTTPEINLGDNQAVIFLGEWQLVFLPVLVP